MSDNASSTPPVPPKPGEAAKVQPKKETVRIALPPKPTAAPTVRLPAPPPGGAAAPGAASAAPSAVAAPRPVASAAPAAPAPAPASRAAAPAPAAAPAAAAAPMPPRPMAAPIVSGISGLDKGLAVAAAIIGLAFLIHVVVIAMGIHVE